LVKMIQILQELEFVTIADGVMRVNKESQKREISESQIYKELKETVIQQELMAIGTFQEIYEWLCVSV
ncbi:single-stranded-DNA-specific exonuclease C-terminal domain-containing protein, partial [Streptococcus suis]